ncbi:c-type cytochrome [Dawidia soli]|uniref:C-type cytochrome n=1 Tax=Dawidia soli TaxID=2782352 RepID=A0AAP2DJK5_9BACT|nr:c-type cytochrome [Dawidia soli]MBT1690672.1 c-type cytochrome [Dawidia soli]
MNKLIKKLFLLGLAACTFLPTEAQMKAPTEDDYYKIITIPTPEGVLLEVGGVATLPDGRVALCTRRGDVWVIENAVMANGRVPSYTLFATGLHEPLGLAYKDNALYAAQRGELTKLVDTDGDGKADVYETVYAWPLSGHYHEYSFGPKIAPDGSFFVTGNVAFGDEEWWRGESRQPWRGWTMHIKADGTMEPWATGMRSPCGLGMIDGELFYDDNQGDWQGSGAIFHVTKGSFTGHPAGLRWTGQANSPVKLTADQFFAKLDERRIRQNGQAVKPENIADEKNPNLLFEVKKQFPEVRLPAVWLPHGVLGISNSEILRDETAGGFGPFAGQIFVGDQGQSKIMRVVMEKVKGEFQGVAFDFRSGFQSGVLRMNWGHDGSLYVGETNRGWGSAGTTTSGFQRLLWTGAVPMEMKTVRAMPDGFEIEFTKPVDKAKAEDLSSYEGRSFIYKYHSVYGSPTINDEKLVIKGVKVSDDAMTVRLVIDNLRQYYLHELNLPGIRSQDGLPVLHATAFYTLNNIPDGTRLAPGQYSTKKSAAAAPAKTTPAKTTAATAGAASSKKAPTYAEIEPLLVKNTCTACHAVNKRQVGPAFADVAKRKYSNERIVQLIYNPEPKNWPEHETPMAPMPQVPKAEALKIAAWINSLRKETAPNP